MLLDNNQKQSKQKTKNKYSLKDCIDYFFNFPYKTVTHDKIILFHAAVLVEKNTMQEGYTERSIK